MEYTIHPLQRSQTAEIYTSHLRRHFPADEVKPLENIFRMWDRGCYRAFGVYARQDLTQNASGHPDSLAGYAFFATAPECRLALLDYFAILETFRGQGTGSLFLREIKKALPGFDGILIETEDADHARNEAELRVRQKRDSFYERNGVRKTKIKSTVYSVHYAIWNLPLTVPSDETVCKKGLEDIYQAMVPGDKYKKHVKIELPVVQDSASKSLV